MARSDERLLMKNTVQQRDILDLTVEVVFGEENQNGTAGFVSSMFKNIWAIEDRQCPGASLSSRRDKVLRRLIRALEMLSSASCYVV